MFMLLSIFLYIFKVYVKISHLNKVYLACFLSLNITFFLERKNDTSLFNKILVSSIVSYIVLCIANFIPNLTIGYLSAFTVAEITKYFQVYHHIDLNYF